MSMCDEVRGILRSATGATAAAGVEAVAIQELLASLAGALAQAAEQDLIAVFEREVQRVLRMRAVRLREIPIRYQVRLVTPTRTSDSIVLGVPNVDSRVQAVLEATCDPNRDLDERDYRVKQA